MHLPGLCSFSELFVCVHRFKIERANKDYEKSDHKNSAEIVCATAAGIKSVPLEEVGNEKTDQISAGGDQGNQPAAHEEGTPKDDQCKECQISSQIQIAAGIP